jgi:hypothetical protein
MPYARLKYLPRRLSQSIYPATVVFNNRPVPGKGPEARLSPGWIDFIHALNPAEKAFRAIIGKARGWVNRDPDDGKVFAESVSMGGNVARVVDEQGQFLRVAAFCAADSPPDPAEINFGATPWLVHKFTCLSHKGVPYLPADGVEAYFPFLFASAETWVETRFVDLFDHLPDPLVPTRTMPQGFPAIALSGAVVRQSPGGVKILKLAESTRVMVQSEVHGWAKIGEQRWVESGWIRRVEE